MAGGYYTSTPYYRVETAEVEKGLLNFSVTARRAVKAYLRDVGCPKLEAYAKRNAGWKDRTHTAREGLTAKVYEKNRASNNRLKQDYTCGVEIYHTAYNSRGQRYGMWLELGAFNVRAGKMNKAFPILEETARIEGAEVVAGMYDIVDRYGGAVFGVDDLEVDVEGNSLEEFY